MDAQRQHWEREYAAAERFGREPSAAASRAALVFGRAGVRRLLDLGCGHGRDALSFAAGGIAVEALDYATSAIDELIRAARAADVHGHVRARVHDVRVGLPFGDASFDAAYAHMLLNMAFLDCEIAAIFAETHRALRDRGIFVFSVRTTDDPDYVAGRPLGRYLRDVEGDVIRFFSSACLDRFCAGFEIVALERFEEGALPKRLALVTLRKPGLVNASGPDASLRLNGC